MRLRLSLALAALSLATACGGGGAASLEFVEIIPDKPRIGDVVTVRFKALDYRGVPLAGAGVDFKLQATALNPGVTLSPTSATTLKGSGFAETQLVANSRINSVIVVATSGDKVVLSPPITFAGSVPNLRQFTFQCGEVSGEGSGGRHAIGVYDQTRSLIAGVKLECTAHVGDRNGDGVEGALVSFMTEAGTVGPSETSLADVVGNAKILHKSSYPLPREVVPERFTWTPVLDATHTGDYVAPLWMHPWQWVANPVAFPRPVATGQEPRRNDPIRRAPDGAQMQLNPRDNLVTMIAVTAGEEGFTDVDNDGKFTQGTDLFDLKDDLTEPFVDADDNGTWNDGERFIDLNGNRTWDGKNGQWDANTLIWVAEKILWTGMPAAEDALGPSPTIYPISGTVTLTCPAGTSNGQECAQAGPPATVSAILADPWYNSMAQNADNDGCTVPDLEEALIKTTPKIVNQGTKFTYPAGEVIVVTVKDARDPLAPPVDQRRAKIPGYPFAQPVICSMTASPLGGHITLIIIGNITGTIE